LIAGLVIAVLLSSQEFYPGARDLLETGRISWISEIPFLVSTRDLFDEEPILLAGPAPGPAWGSFESVSLQNPLEAGIWAGSGWAAVYKPSAIPDSSFRSTVGLIENTKGRNRYSGTLLRPFPGGFRFAATLAREDTLSRQAIRLSSGSFDLSGSFWQQNSDGSSAWLRFRSEKACVRAGIGMPGPGLRLAECLASIEIPAGALTAELAAGASGAESLGAAEGHALLRLRIGNGSIVCRADARRQGGGSIEGGWAAGATMSRGILSLSGGAAATPGDKPSLLATASIGGAGFEAIYRSGGFSFGAHASGPFGLGGSAGFRADTLRLAGSLIPSLRWGSSGLLKGGAMAAYTRFGDSGDEVRMDLLGMLSISRFSLVIATENVTGDSSRHYSYGLVWSFDDAPDAPQTEEGRGGGQ
jgi:hypothetical protein